MATLSELQGLFSIKENSRSFMDEDFDRLHTFLYTLFCVNEKDREYTKFPEMLWEFLSIFLMAGNFLRIDVSAAFRAKYRKVCPRCRLRPCECWDEAIKPLFRPYPGPLPKERSLTQIQRMLNWVFPSRQSLMEEVCHLHSEIEELRQAFLCQDVAGMKEEVADIFAWFMRVTNTLGISLDEQGPL